MALDHHRLVSACGHPAGTEAGGGEESVRVETGSEEGGGGGSPVPQSDATEGSGSVSADKQTQVAV